MTGLEALIFDTLANARCQIVEQSARFTRQKILPGVNKMDRKRWGFERLEYNVQLADRHGLRRLVGQNAGNSDACDSGIDSRFRRMYSEPGVYGNGVLFV